VPIIFTSRLTAAGTITLPRSGMHLVRVRVFGGTLPGSFRIRYRPSSVAHFPTPVSGFADYPVSWGPLSASLDSSIFSLSAAGHPAIIELQFADAPMGGPPIETYRAIEFRRVDAGAVTADITTTYDDAPNVPKAIVGMISASAGRAQFASVGGVRAQVEASPEEFLSSTFPAPTITPQSSLVLTVITDAAATIGFWVYY
jgi:hypothetical protein